MIHRQISSAQLSSVFSWGNPDLQLPEYKVTTIHLPSHRHFSIPPKIPKIPFIHILTHPNLYPSRLSPDAYGSLRTLSLRNNLKGVTPN
jgi:hypothetical protein